MAAPEIISESHVAARKPIPSEKRLIIRQLYQFFTYIVVGGVYRFPSGSANSTDSESKLTKLETYVPALTACIAQHPFLSAIVLNPGTKNETFGLVKEINLESHFVVVGKTELRDDLRSDLDLDIEENLLRRALEYISDEPELGFFGTVSEIPAWRLVVVPLSSAEDGQSSVDRVAIFWAYAHSHGDGMSGLALQETFYKALVESFRQGVSDISVLVKTNTTVELPVLPHLPVSLSYLLTPALGHYLPTFIGKLFGLKASVSGTDQTTWTGPATFITTHPTTTSSTTSVTPTKPNKTWGNADNKHSDVRLKTAVEVLAVDAKTLTSVLTQCRANSSRLTALLNETIAKVLFHILPKYTTIPPQITNFVSVTATNIRKPFGISNSTIGNFGSGSYARHTFDRFATPPATTTATTTKIEHGGKWWPQIRSQTSHLAHVSNERENQPVGLLSWINDFPEWMSSQIGQTRDGSWEVSNLGLFCPTVTVTNSDNNDATGSGGHTVTMEKIMFNQPANAVNPPLAFSVVSLEKGDMVICLSWQICALGFSPLPSSSSTPSSTISNQDEGIIMQVEKKEREFARLVLSGIEEVFENICRTA